MTKHGRILMAGCLAAAICTATGSAFSSEVKPGEAVSLTSLNLAASPSDGNRTSRKLSNRKLAQFFGQVCQTPFGWCWLGVPFPVGSSCFCASIYGPQAGIVR